LAMENRHIARKLQPFFESTLILLSSNPST
jgi:hypothetical protein